ncbi:MAG: sulfotransferase family 2 domain-containing protein [Hyphomicrobiales bacterium]|nr:sulfotransferase family 2 domain-containing protein [Hyphomicrobiales bacterium]
MNKSVFAVIRIPKSGSSTLAKIVRSGMPDAVVYGLPNSYFGEWTKGPVERIRFLRSEKRHLLKRYRTLKLETALAFIDEQCKDGDMISGGHICYETFENLRTPKKYITLFRNPIDRIRSEYNYNRNAYYNRFALNRFDSAFNKKVAARHDLDGYVSVLLEHKTHYGNIAANMLGVTRREDIDDRLKSLFHFGVMEDLNNFAGGLGDKLGRRVDVVHANKTQKQFTHIADGPTQRKIEKLDDIDLEIYEKARQYLN